jgi:hypothetical protein
MPCKKHIPNSKTKIQPELIIMGLKDNVKLEII